MKDQSEHCLSGIRVLDLSSGGAQICGKMLADLGADVIKVEPPGGDGEGRIAPFYKNIPDPEKSLFWFAYNTNKRGITLNLETDDGAAIFKRLVESADFVIESFDPGYLDSLGLGYAALSEVNHGIILTSITPFGQTGPKSHYKASDLTIWASTGGLYATGDPDRPPVWTNFPQTFIHAGVEACAATLIAYYYWLQTGKGQHVDVSAQDTFIISTDEVHLLSYELMNHVYHRRGNRKGVGDGPGGRQQYQCKDGYVAFMLLVLVGTPNTGSMVQWMAEEGMAPDWLINYDWINNYDMSNITREEVDRVEQVFADFFMTKTKAELLDGAIKRNIQLVPVCTAEDIYNAEQWRVRDFWVDVEHDELDDTLAYCGLFRQFSETPGEIWKRAPLIGEHNLQIYQSELGYTTDQLDVLKCSGAI